MVIKRIRLWMSWLLALSSPVLLLSLSRADETASAIHPDIQLAGPVPFQTAEDILESVEILKDSTNRINMRLLEESLLELNGVQRAEVFSDLGGQLFIQIEQEYPLLRLFDTDTSYYLSQNGCGVALSPYHTAKVPVVSGASLDRLRKPLHALFVMIDEDEILRQGIDAAWVNEDEELTLYAAWGCDHRIRFGHLEQEREKLSKLKVFYQEIVSTGRRTQFEQLDLRFEGQVVLKK